MARTTIRQSWTMWTSEICCERPFRSRRMPEHRTSLIGSSVLDLREAAKNKLGGAFTDLSMNEVSDMISFLGLGDANQASWGQIIHLALYHVGSWWLVVFPGLAIFLLCFGFNLMGDGISYALNPRLHTQVIKEINVKE